MLANRRLYNFFIFLILLIGAALRLVYVSRLDNKLWWEDEIDYLTLGQSIASGHGYVHPDGEPTAFRPPGYPLLLAGLDKIGLDTVSEIRLVHVFLSTITLFILFLLSLKIAGPAAALVATAVAAGYPYFIFGAGTLFAFTWFSLTLLASCYFLLSGTTTGKLWLFAVAGLLMGLSILTRTSATVLGLMTILWLVIVLHRQPRTFIKMAFIYAFMMATVVTPWLLRNYFVLGKPVLSTNGGRNLWLGNNPESTINTGSDIALPAELETRIEKATEIEADAMYAAEAKKFIRTHPSRSITLMAQKGLAFWRLDPSPTTDGYPRYKNKYSMISILSYTPVLLFAVIGFWLADSSRKKMMLLWILYALAFTLLHAVYITKVRFRLPLDYFLIIMAGCAASFLLQHSILIKRLPTRFSAGLFHEHNSPTLSLPFIRRR